LVRCGETCLLEEESGYRGVSEVGRGLVPEAVPPEEPVAFVASEMELLTLGGYPGEGGAAVSGPSMLLTGGCVLGGAGPISSKLRYLTGGGVPFRVGDDSGPTSSMLRMGERGLVIGDADRRTVWGAALAAAWRSRISRIASLSSSIAASRLIVCCEAILRVFFFFFSFFLFLFLRCFFCVSGWTLVL